MSVPTGQALLGRVVNPLGQPIDEKGSINTKQVVLLNLEPLLLL